MAVKMPSASVVVMTHNRAGVLQKTLDAMLKQDYAANYEIVVVNDGSTDKTREMLAREFGGEKRIKVLNQKRSFPCRARNNGIKNARNNFVVIMDDDCIPARNWLGNLMIGFFENGALNKKIGVVSSFHEFGGTSTAFKREALTKVGGYDENYRYYREDTDLVFRILDAGYENRVVKNAKFRHEHKMENPQGLSGWIRYGLERCGYHMNDVLLYKNNPARAEKFLDVKMGFLVNPFADWATATNQWGKGGELRLGSPRGLTFVQNKSPMHALAIIGAAWGYVLCVKAYRLSGSIKFGKLLV
ncbi:MAG: glycosyltransferase family A protein [Candidatus Diapherotrites archaeon]|nr:glycosyltransferase family 2 protein [Candidatus Micrarchaeota archaeon]MBU1939967.1 glycosyltransferase family 2 protein [Candidatus Micrarchaeota archaeon]